jgi:hypothetical protein
MRFNNRAMALAGIPDLPEDAFKHCGDKKIKPQSGGGGGGQTTSTSYTTNLPDYVQPQFERLLGKAEAFSESPYVAYKGERQAEFDPLQEQGFRDTANLGVTGQVGAGTQMAGAAGIGSMTAGDRYAAQATDPYATMAYMSPYMDAAVAPQMREARRQADITAQQQASKAAMQGAFGGSRHGLVEAEGNRNLQTQLGDIYGKGRQTAFEQARDAQRFAAELGLKGYGQGLESAKTLGELGKTQYAQQEAGTKAKLAAGQMRQARQQAVLDQRYQDFLSQRGDPQQKLAFFSDVLRGAPVGGQTMQQYQAQPSGMAQLVGPGLLGLGMYKEFMK